MSYCSSCGTKISENQKFCPNCGQKVKENEPIKGDPPSIPVTKKKTSKVIIVLAILIMVVIIVVVGTVYKRQKQQQAAAIELEKKQAAELWFKANQEWEQPKKEWARQNAEIERQIAERERIAGELKNNPGKYIIGYNCVVTVIEKKLFHAITNVDNCNFENRSSFWIKGINGYAFIEDKSGNTIKTAFHTDCTLEPRESKSCVTKSNQVKNGKRAIKIEITSVGYSSNGVW